MEDLSQEHEEHGGHRGGTWKVAYADFVTALMALFIVLWLMNAREDVRQKISAYFRDPHGIAALSGSAHGGSGEALTLDKASINDLRNQLQQAMQDLPDFKRISDHVLFTVAAEGLRVELLEKEAGLFFETGSARPTQQGQQLFALLAAQLRELPNPIIIEGHTDSRPFRSQELDSYGNWELSFDRANMARRTMIVLSLIHI